MKNIVICCDGTQGKFDSRAKNTNVVRLYERLGPESPEQISFYDPGVGTSRTLQDGWHRRVLEWVWNGLASISGFGLRDNVAQAYRYLMEVYEPEDRIYLFGFSRGAHTVRVLAGMLYRCGLLTRGNQNLIPSVMQVYYDRKNETKAIDFKSTFSRPCSVHFIGVWDTVASVGWLWWRRYFRDARLNKDIKFGYQALSIDEKRRHFRPSIWHEHDLPDTQTIEQVWFAGHHADVGGQKADRAISDIPLIWMLEHAKAAHLKLRSNWRDGLDPHPCGKIKQSWVWFWCLIPWEKRAIYETANIHPSVRERQADTACRYRPTNLPPPDKENDESPKAC